MSLIHEALQKAQKKNNIQEKNSKGYEESSNVIHLLEPFPESVPEKNSQEIIVKKDGGNNQRTVLIFALICLMLVVFLLGFIGWHLMNQASVPQQPKATLGLSQQAEETSIAEISNETVLDLQLTGIFQEENQRVALLNNKMVRKGETINGARVLRIDDKSVTLVYNDEEFNITL